MGLTPQSHESGNRYGCDMRESFRFREEHAEFLRARSEFVIFSNSEGVISEHDTEGDLMKAFVEHLKKHKGPVWDEAVIYKRSPDGWDLF